MNVERLEQTSPFSTFFKGNNEGMSSSGKSPLVGFQAEVLNMFLWPNGICFPTCFLHLMKLTGSEKYLQETNPSRYSQQTKIRHLHSKVGSAVLNASTFHDSDFP